jgi:hypothetical protein
MMLGEESESADYWKKCGDEALARGIKGVIMMVCGYRLEENKSTLIDKRERTGAAQERTVLKFP